MIQELIKTLFPGIAMEINTEILFGVTLMLFGLSFVSHDIGVVVGTILMILGTAYTSVHVLLYLIEKFG